MKGLASLCVASMLVAANILPAAAQSLKNKVEGSWKLASGSENFPEGKKLQPWADGSMIIANGHVSLFLIGKDRPKTGPSVRTPVGPTVAYYGTYTVDEAKNTMTISIAYGASPLFDGTKREQKISIAGDTMTIVGADVKTPEGTMTPINVWQKLK